MIEVVVGVSIYGLGVRNIFGREMKAHIKFISHDTFGFCGPATSALGEQRQDHGVPHALLHNRYRSLARVVAPYRSRHDGEERDQPLTLSLMSHF